jgi:hypothetical protein
MNKILPAVLILFCLTIPALGQEPDSLKVSQEPGQESAVLDSIYRLGEEEVFVADSLYVDSLVREFDEGHSPTKATLYALVLPGMGQAYNKKYYKIPIVWAALGGVGYAISFNSQKYREARDEFAQDPNQDERPLRYWRRNLELSYIGLIVVYALQTLDAYVDAQLYNWNVNENLSMRVAPSLQPLMHPASLTGQSVGITCSLKIRGK